MINSKGIQMIKCKKQNLFGFKSICNLFNPWTPKEVASKVCSPIVMIFINLPVLDLCSIRQKNAHQSNVKSLQQVIKERQASVDLVRDKHVFEPETWAQTAQDWPNQKPNQNCMTQPNFNWNWPQQWFQKEGDN